MMLRMDPSDTSQDDVISTLAVSARAMCETVTQRRFVQQTWSMYMDFFPGYIDLKLAGQRVSSPFVSGSNAVLVGIRYAVVLPYPPVQQLESFIYQNANGEVTSMIVGPTTISGVTNTTGQPVSIYTAQPHGLGSGSSVTIAGNSPLLSLLGAATWDITVTDPNDFTLNNSVGTGTSIASGGTVTGLNFVSDLQSQPARLMPLFGQMWPVARVVANAVQMTYTVGYATPFTVAVSGTSITGTFSGIAVGQPISIPGAGVAGGTLNTIIEAWTTGTITTRDAPSTNISSTTALIVNNGIPAHWEMIRAAIKVLVNGWYTGRLPNDPKVTRQWLDWQLAAVKDWRL